MTILYAAGTIPGTSTMTSTSSDFRNSWVRGAVLSSTNYIPTLPFEDVKAYHLCCKQTSSDTMYSIILGGYRITNSVIQRFSTSWQTIVTLPSKTSLTEYVILKFTDRHEIYRDQILVATVLEEDFTANTTVYAHSSSNTNTVSSEIILTDSPNDFLLGAKVADVTVSGDGEVDPDFVDMISFFNSAKEGVGSFAIVDKTQAMKAVAMSALPAQAEGEEAFFYINCYSVANGEASVEMDGSHPLPAGYMTPIADSKGEVSFSIKMGA